MQRTLQTHQKALGVLRGAVIWGYLGSANRLIGCGGGCNITNLLAILFSRSLIGMTYK